MSSVKTKQTVVVTGSVNGGTSITALLCERLGFNMGDDKYRYEDKDMHRAVCSGNEERCRKAIEDRGEKWGFKYPRLTRELIIAEQWLTNPYFIFVYRDPVAVHSRVLDNHFHVKTTCEHNMRMVEVAEQLENVLEISYEKLLTKPHASIERLASFLYVEITAEKVDELAKLIKAEHGHPPI